MTTSQTRVAIFLHGLGANGIDSLFANLATHWSNNLEIYYFLAIDENATLHWDAKVADSNVHIIKLGDLDKGRLKYWPITVYKALKRYGTFDVIHSNMDFLNGLTILPAKLAGVSTRISHAHRANHTSSSNKIKNIIAGVYRWSMRTLTNRLSTGLLACDYSSGKYFFKNYPFSVIDNGIDLLPFLDRPQNDMDYKWRFITVGRIDTPKNPLRIIRIFAEIKKLIPEATLTWLGSGALKHEVDLEITKFGLQDSIYFGGAVTNVHSYLHKADYFLLPSLFEGLPLVLIEAQAAGLQCFASDVCPELIDCGNVKFISLGNSDESWAQQIVSSAKSRVEIPNLTKLSRFDIKTKAIELQRLYCEAKNQ